MITNFNAGALGIRSYIFIAIVSAVVVTVGFLNLAMPRGLRRRDPLVLVAAL
jgi:hypothetical protein